MDLRKPERGFTLIEVAVAVALFGLAVTTLVTLQTRYMDTHSNESDRTLAALYARSLLSTIALSGEVPELGEETQRLDVKLREEKLLNDDSLPRHEIERLERWTYHRRVERETEFEQILQMEDVVRRITISIRWGEAPNQQYDLFYLVQNDPLGNTLLADGATGTTPATNATGGSAAAGASAPFGNAGSKAATSGNPYIGLGAGG